MTVCVAQACAGVEIPPVRPALDPLAIERFALAFGPKDVLLVLEAESRADRGTHRTLAAYDPREKSRRHLAALSPEVVAALDSAPGRAEIGTVLASSELASLIDQLGFVWLTPAATPPVLSEGRLVARDDGVWLVDAPDEVRVMELAPTQRLDAWLISADGRRLAVELVSDGLPRARGVEVIDVPRAASRLASARGYRVHLAEDFDAAVAYFAAALRHDPTDPLPRYNLACALSRAGRPHEAVPELVLALHYGGGVYRRLAQRDPDLESLRKRLDLWPVIEAAEVGDGERR